MYVYITTEILSPPVTLLLVDVSLGAVRNYRSLSRREKVSFMGGWVEESFVLKIIDS